MIIDCHTHCYPDELVADPRGWAEARRELHWADLVAPKGRRTIQDWAAPGKFLREMDRAGVDRAVLLGWYWENEATCRWHNQVISEWMNLAPDRFIGFAAILPNRNVIDQLDFAARLGLRGVGELHPGVQGFDSSNPNWRAMAAWCAERDWPVNCHATSELGKDHPNAIATPLKDYVRMARDEPSLKLILAHFGGGLPLMGKSGLPENLYFDCSASPLLYPEAPFREAVDTIGLKQILFGSDYPLRIYPRSQKRAEMTSFIDSVRSDPKLNKAELDAILGRNLEELLHL